MFDLQDKTLTKTIADNPVVRMKVEAPPEEEYAGHALDSAQSVELHGRLMGFYRLELDRQSENRCQMALDEDYYDNEQWTEEEKAILRRRGQAPLVYNVIATSVDWILGSEKRGRTDFKILPRGKEDAKPAEGKTKYMKYLSDVNKAPFQRSRAFEDTVKVGVGWLEESIQDEDDGEPIYMRYESWRNILWDSSSTELDGSDMRYVFRSKWVDEDIAKALFPDRAELVERSVSTGTTYSSVALYDGDFAMDAMEEELADAANLGSFNTIRRRRVRLIECWYRGPSVVRKLKGGALDGALYDPNNGEHARAVAAKVSRVVTKTRMSVRVCIMTTAGLLYEGPSPFKHNRFKFVPIWGYRRGANNLPYGIIRRLRDIQDDINKRASKALAILSSNKVAMEEGVLPDDVTPEDFADEVSAPDGILRFKNGALSGNRVNLAVDRDLAMPHLELMSRGINMIQQASGVSDELLGRTTNAVSGVAVEKRQEQGSLATTKFFDNLRFAEQCRGEMELSLVEQFVTDEKQFRITNQRGTPEFVTINDGLPENDITRTQADFVISEADWRATMRQAAAAELMDLVAKMPPQVGMVLLDLLVDDMDITNRDEITKRIRAITGQRDPDATELTPEEQQQMQAAAAAQQMQMRAAEAEVTLKEAQAQKAAAEADRAAAAVLLTKAQAVQANMTGAQAAMTAATMVITQPTTAKVADQLLMQGGWDGGQPVPTNVAPAPQPQPGPAPAPVPPAAPQQQGANP